MSTPLRPAPRSTGAPMIAAAFMRMVYRTVAGAAGALDSSAAPDEIRLVERSIVEVEMSVTRVNGVELYYQSRGSGEPLVLVHGSWGDHHNWDPVVAALAESFRVVAYDRRGHSASERPAGQGSVFEDAD